MVPRTAKKFRPGVDWVWYAPHTHDAYGDPEIAAVVNSLKKGWLTTGPITKEFEHKIAGMYGKKHGLFVNSGSSANLLAFEALNLPEGSEVITAACNFNTTVAPIVQKGLVPVFVDVKPGHYTLDPRDLPKALSKKTKAIIVPHLIGNIADLSAIRTFARNHGLALIEDSCDTINSRYEGKKTGTFTDVTTTSFYASHLITAGGTGGMVMFNEAKLRERARVFRDWGRGISKHDDKIRSRLSTFKIDGQPYDSAFVFIERGYHLRPTEMQAAFALAQLRRLPAFTKARRRNYTRLRKFLSRYEDRLILPQEETGATVNWLAFPITLRSASRIERNDLAKYLEDRKIQTRPLFSGNITKHPAYRGVGRTIGKLPASNTILNGALLVGLHHGITDEMLDYMCEVMESYFINR